MAQADPHDVPEDRAERWAAVLPHRDRLLAMARPRTPSPDDAEDVVQEALLRAVEFPDLDDERLGQFLTSVTVRLCADEHRRAGVVAKRAPKLAGPESVPGPDESVCDRAEASWVARLVAALPARQREVLVARSDGLTNSEISTRYRMSYKAVESTLSRARATARAAFAATLSLLALFRRPKTALGGATLTSMAVLALGQLAITGPTPDGYAGGDGGATAGLRPTRTVREAERPAAAGPAVRRSTLPAPVRGATVEPPVRTPSGRGSLGFGVPAPSPGPGLAPRTVVGVDHEPNEYSPVERVNHCVEHGVSITPQKVECRYPYPSPSPSPRP